MGLLRVLAARNRLLFSRYEDLLSLPVAARVAKMMLDLSEEGQKPIKRTENSIRKIAAISATVPEAISRSIKTFRDLGIIESSRTKITIISSERLKKMAQIEPIEFRS